MTAAAILQQQPANRFEALVIKGNAGNLRPTLYDLLAHKALDFYKTAIALLQSRRLHMR